MLNQGHDGPTPNLIANLDELEGYNPELAAAIRKKEDLQLTMLNEAIKVMTPDDIIRRLKMLLWRLAPTLRLSEMVQLDYGAEVLSVSLRSAVVGITDAVKWIGWKNGLDPLAPFGDDTIIVAIRDMMLGQNPGVPTPQHESSESGLDDSAPAGKNGIGTDGDQDI